MKRINLVVLSLMLGFVFVISLGGKTKMKRLFLSTLIAAGLTLVGVNSFAAEEYVVKEGDTLSGIAKEVLGSEGEWRAIAELNNIENPDIIYVGQRLRLPSAEKAESTMPAGKEMSKAGQTVKGNIICVEVDEQGNLNAVEKTECTGLFVVVGKDGKLYTLYGSEKEMKKMAMMAKEKKVSGEVGGNQRAWILYASPIEGQTPVEKTVEGTIVCLLPNYEKGTVNPVVASGPCTEAGPHAHVIRTEDGQIYALHGSEEAIHKIEMNPQRKDVTVKGKLQGNPGAWILFVE